MYYFLLISSFGFLDFLVFLYLVQFVFFLKDSLLWSMFEFFLGEVRGYYSYDLEFPMSYSVSIIMFMCIFTFCFGGFLPYSSCPLGSLEFALLFSVTSWLSVLLVYVTGEKFSVYMSKKGDSYLKVLSSLAVEFASELARPTALTIRLFANVTAGHFAVYGIYRLVDGVLENNLYGVLIILAAMAECVVFSIQSFIFGRLIYLYLNE